MAEETKEKFDNYKYQQQYIKENVKFVHVPMNMKFPDEKKLFDYLTDHAKETGEKKSTYIKRLIREDMEKVHIKRPEVKTTVDFRELLTPDVIPFPDDE